MEAKLFGGLDFNQIGGENSEWLERAIEKEEVHVEVECCAGDKAAGPDGSTLAFFQHC